MYNYNDVNLFEIKDTLDKYWKNKDSITLEFCFAHPVFMEKDKKYIVKGLNDNIDNTIPYNELPHVDITSVIPFKGNLVHDGILIGIDIKIETEFDEKVERKYVLLIKYYHL